ncbi:uncharacterized protein LOC100164407 isoform X3 [Acyrthosiphon pisum]|uniref:Uncharacterized protein n=1 Tax=Acyrthosiphon pisum TaxID=7029 RepID=A0A8R2NT29_ACYPI|nr:uncharacterized protein LOC100164407 isoform X3 [Acyrthosiphon pisum]
MLIKLLIPRLLVTASVLLVVTVGVRAPRTPVIEIPIFKQGPRDFGKHDYSSPVEHKRTREHEYRPTDTYDTEHIHPPRDSNTYTDSWHPNLLQSHTEESWLNQMLIKIIGSLRTSANETIAVQELIKEDIPRKEESQNSSELIQNCTHHVEQIQKRMLTFKDQQINVLESIVEFEQAYEILRVSWKTKLTNILSKTYSLEARIFLRKIEDERPVRCPPENIREKTRTADKLQVSSKPATTLRQALAQLYIQDHVKLEITNCTHQIDHFQKQMRLFEDQQINVYDSITELKQDYKLLIESWETELKNMTERKVPIEEVYKKLYEDIQLLRSTDHKQEIIMDYTQKLDELQVSSELVMPLEKLRKRLIFLTDPFKWEHSIWQLNSNESWKPVNLTHDLKQNKWIVFKQIDPLLKRWRLVAKTVPDITLGEDRGRVEPTNSGSRMMQNSTWTFLGKIRWNDTNCDLQQCGWLVFNQTDPLLNHWRLVVSSPIIIEEQQNPSEPHTTLENSHSYVVPTVPSKTASEQPKSLEILTTTTTIDPMLVDELQDPTNPFNLGQGYGNLHLSKPVVYEDMSTWNFPDQTSRVP